MNREQQSTKKEQPTPLWRSNHIVKKTSYSYPHLSFFKVSYLLSLYSEHLALLRCLQHAPPEWFYNLSLSFSFVLAQF